MTPQRTQEIIMTVRRVELALSTLILILIITYIIKKRLYVYNTSKLFMFVCMMYLVGMLVVLLHLRSFTADQYYMSECKDPPNDANKYCRNQIIDAIKHSGNVMCGIQAFINLFCYNLGYFFAVLITYNVDCVLNNQHRNFMRRIFKNKKVIAFLVFMAIVYLMPIVMMYTGCKLSYGPAGFTLMFGQNSKTLIFFCGPFTSEIDTYKTWLLALYMYFLPVAMFIYHALILLQVRRKRKQFLDLEYLNSKQRFIINSNWLSVLVFSIQAFNLLKQLLSLSIPNTGYQIFIICLNFVFDLYPVLLLLAIRRIQFKKNGQLTETIVSYNTDNSEN